MSSNPYENEPGFENANADDDKKAQSHYAAKVPRLDQSSKTILVTSNALSDTTRIPQDLNCTAS